jgi:hypothetical protein
MDFKHTAQAMFECWVLGAAMIYLVKNSKYASLLKIDKAGLWKFAKLLMLTTALRIVWLKFIVPQEVADGLKNIGDMLSWQSMLFVYWEDACHTLPLVILKRMYKNTKWFRWVYPALLGATMASFGIGHAYEGLGAVFMMAIYVPWTMKLGEKYGFGTVMLCHIAYDILTFFTFKWTVG